MRFNPKLVQLEVWQGVYSTLKDHRFQSQTGSIRGKLGSNCAGIVLVFQSQTGSIRGQAPELVLLHRVRGFNPKLVQLEEPATAERL